MFKIYNLKDKLEYINEVATITQNEWGSKVNSKEEFEQKVNKKIIKIINSFDNPYYCKLILLDDNILVGFISMFEFDYNDRKDLFPWYATMYVKEEYRNKGYSKILNDAILKEARNRRIKKIYLKTELKNYYEKFGAKFLCDLNDKEKIFYFDL